MTYGYDANIYKNRSTLHMMSNAENLLFEIQAARSSERLQSHRIVFIGHGLGGILIKKALSIAREEEKYQNLLNSTITTWQLSFEYLKPRNPFTAEVFSFLGVLDRQHIPKFLAYALEEDKLKVDEALNQLLAFCLIRTEASNEYLELHDLVEIVLHAWMKRFDNWSHWLGIAMEVFDELFPTYLLRQAQSDGEAVLLNKTVLSSLQLDLARVLDAKEEFLEAEKIAMNALSSKSPLSACLDGSTCTGMVILASILCHLLKEKEAEELHCQMLEHYGDDKRSDKNKLSRQERIGFSAISRIVEVDGELPLVG